MSNIQSKNYKIHTHKNYYKIKSVLKSYKHFWGFEGRRKPLVWFIHVCNKYLLSFRYTLVILETDIKKGFFGGGIS